MTIVGGAAPGLLVLGAVRNQTEQAMVNKPVSSRSVLVLPLASYTNRVKFILHNFSITLQPQVAFGQFQSKGCKISRLHPHRTAVPLSPSSLSLFKTLTSS